MYTHDTWTSPCIYENWLDPKNILKQKSHETRLNIGLYKKNVLILHPRQVVVIHHKTRIVIAIHVLLLDGYFNDNL